MNSRSATLLEAHVLDTGFCTVSEHHLVTSGRRRKVRCHSIAALLCHPAHGWFLWDTGYAPRILDAAQSFPYRAYLYTAPMEVSPDWAVASQLSRFGLGAGDIAGIWISHFHADHVAGLRDFPLAKLVSTRDAWEDVRGRKGWPALKRAFLPSLVPEDFERRAMLIDRFEGSAIWPFGATYDLFGDGSAMLVRLPGHARGQIGLLARTASGRMLFAADSCWTSAAIRERAVPHFAARIVTDDWGALRQTIGHLADFAQANPDVSIVPTHCPEIYRALFGERGEPG